MPKGFRLPVEPHEEIRRRFGINLRWLQTHKYSWYAHLGYSVYATGGEKSQQESLCRCRSTFEDWFQESSSCKTFQYKCYCSRKLEYYERGKSGFVHAENQWLQRLKRSRTDSWWDLHRYFGQKVQAFESKIAWENPLWLLSWKSIDLPQIWHTSNGSSNDRLELSYQ